jgi:hypothetical protein
MVRHIVLFRWKPGTSQQSLESLEHALAGMPKLCPSIRRYRFGRNLGLQEGGFDFGIVADFADAAAWREYWANEAHQKLIAEKVRPIVAERVALQLELERE